MRTKQSLERSFGERVRRFVAIAASASLVGGGVVATVIGSASRASAALVCDQSVDAGGFHGTSTTIQDAIDAATVGQTICVWPGLYNQDQANGRDPNTGAAGSNDFNIFVGKSLTIQGLDAFGNAITSAPQGALSTAAPVIEAARAVPDFGTSNIFVQADNVTLRGLEINGTPNDIDKSVEIVGNGDTVTDDAFTPSSTSGGVGIYISDYHFDSGLNLSTVQSYTFTDNTFDGTQAESAIYVANGAGWSGPVSGRVISGNTFSNLDDAMDFAGPTTNIGWLLYPVGTATITGNTFSSIGRRHLEVWGSGGPGVGYGSPDWCGIMAGNTFDAGSFIWQGSPECPSGTARTWNSGDFTSIAGLYSTIQQYGINKSLANDTVQVLRGTYDEALTINHALTLRGANAGISGTAARVPESLVERLAGQSGPAFHINTTDPVTIDGFHAQFNGTDAVGGALLSTGTGNQLTFSNNVVNNSTYNNALVYDTSAATSTFSNNLFTNDHQSGAGGTGLVAAWGTAPTLAVLSFTGNTFSHLSDQDGVPAVNLNTVSGVVSANTFQDIHQYGILLADKLGPLSISNNLFDNIHNDTPLTSGNRGSAIRTFGVPTFVGTVSVTGNTFSNDYHGVRVANDGSPASLPNGGLLVNRNAFLTNTAAGVSLASGTTGTLDGSCNWWGQAAGPGVGAVDGAVTTAAWLITNNLAGSCLPTVNMGTAVQSTVESNSGSHPVSLPVTLDRPSSKTVSVFWHTMNGTAGVGDYNGASGTLTFAPFQTAKTIIVNVLGDTVLEANETFSVVLQTPTNATLGNASEQVLILNDDKPSMSVSSVSVIEGNTATFTVTLSDPYYQPIVVNVATANGTAHAPGDYTAVSTTITIPAGTTSKTFSVTTKKDLLNEPAEAFSVTFASSSISNSPKTATGTIQANHT